jgi:hypothetical protein
MKTLLIAALLLGSSGCCDDEPPETFNGKEMSSCFSVGDDVCCTYDNDSCSETVCKSGCWENVESWYCW